MIPFLGDLIGNIVGIAGDYFKDKRKLKAAKVNAELAVYQARATADIDWDKQALINAQSSWKDEYILILFSPPLIMAFIPGLAPYVGLGFAELALMPDWYKASIGIMVAGSYGYKKLMSFFERKSNGN